MADGPDPAGLSPAPEHYLDNTTLPMRLLRFLNLLEPGRAVVSVSKLMMWFMLAALVWVLVARPDQLAAMIGAVGGFFGAAGNYAYRRWMQNRGGNP